jgi:hypothetical protein
MRENVIELVKITQHASRHHVITQHATRNTHHVNTNHESRFNKYGKSA